MHFCFNLKKKKKISPMIFSLLQYHYCDHKKLLGPSGELLKWYSQPITSMHMNELARGKKNSPNNVTLVWMATFYWLRGSVKNHFSNPPMDLGFV